MKISVNQIYYSNEQEASLDPSFVPFFNTSNTGKKWFEYYVFLKEYEKISNWDNLYLGYISWKFGAKTGIQGKTFTEFIANNPGQDVYFINPFLLESLSFKNQWIHGEYHHAGLNEITKYIFEKLGYDVSILSKPVDYRLQLFANYWVGNKKFWDLYIAYSKPIYEFIENGNDPFIQSKISLKADQTIDAPFIPFLMERLFTNLIVQDKSIHFLEYAYSNDEMHRKYPIVSKFIPALISLSDMEKLAGNSIEIDAIRSEFWKANELLFVEFQNISQVSLWTFDFYKLVLSLKSPNALSRAFQRIWNLLGEKTESSNILRYPFFWRISILNFFINKVKSRLFSK